MAITNGYCTLAEVKAACRITDALSDTLLENVIEGASRRIDGYCGRFFYQVANTAISFYTNNEFKVLLPDIASANITVKTDDNGDGTFETTWSAGQYRLEPTDVVLQTRPYYRLVTTGIRTFPIFSYPPMPGLQVTATWGWPSIPDDVREACILLSMRMFSRYNSPLGVAGFGDMGAITVRAVDPDIRDLLNPYVLQGVA
jgi:hypothetical protein